MENEQRVTGGARVAYWTHQWGGVPGTLHFEIHMDDGGVSQVTVDAGGIKVFAPHFLALDEWGLSMNACELRFVAHPRDVPSKAPEALRERAHIRRELAELARRAYRKVGPTDRLYLDQGAFEAMLDKVCPEEEE